MICEAEKATELELGADAAFSNGGTEALIRFLLDSDLRSLMPATPVSVQRKLSFDDATPATGHCPTCECGRYMTPHTTEGDWVCHGCGTCRLMDAGTQACHGGFVSWADATDRTTTAVSRAYDRKNRLSDVLNQTHNRKRASLPRDVADEIRHAFSGVTVRDSITIGHVKTYMKVRGWGIHYKYAPAILFEIAGRRKTPQIPHDMEGRIFARHAMLQRPFETLVKPTFKRKNFMCLKYVMRQCLYLEGASSALQEAYVITSNTTRLTKLDDMWRVMCDALSWSYRPLCTETLKRRRPAIPK
jgi:Poxvirus Late Transcription Factor VLTF3 like